MEIEPGRSLYGNAGIHLCSVTNVKRQTLPIPYTWVETDTSEAFLPDVNLERNRWTVCVAGRANDPAEITADLVGISCGFDVIVPEAHLPEVRAGEVLAFIDTGAYQDANATNFNALPRPATVLVTDDQAELVASVHMGGNDYRIYFLSTHKVASGGGKSGWTLWHVDGRGGPFCCRVAFAYPYSDRDAAFVAEQLLTKVLEDEHHFDGLPPERATLRAAGLLSAQDLKRIFAKVFAA